MSDVVGYMYQADLYCPDCIRNMFGRNVLDVSAESLLDREAKTRGVNRSVEGSFDSGYFPKVVLGSQVHDGCFPDNGYERGQCGDRCGSCGDFLGSDCPNCESE